MYGSFSTMARDHANSVAASGLAVDRARAARQERRARRAANRPPAPVGYVARHAALPSNIVRSDLSVQLSA